MMLQISAILTPELDLGERLGSLLNSHGQTNILALLSRFFVTAVETRFGLLIFWPFV
jgi:hypothetical protein